MKLKYKFATQKVGSGIVAVAIEEDALNYSGILRMNSTGAFILQQLQSDISCTELTERILQKYDADKATVEKILVDFLGMLSMEKLLLDNKKLKKIITFIRIGTNNRKKSKNEPWSSPQSVFLYLPNYSITD